MVGYCVNRISKDNISSLDQCSASGILQLAQVSKAPFVIPGEKQQSESGVCQRQCPLQEGVRSCLWSCLLLRAFVWLLRTAGRCPFLGGICIPEASQHLSWCRCFVTSDRAMFLASFLSQHSQTRTLLPPRLLEVHLEFVSFRQNGSQFCSSPNHQGVIRERGRGELSLSPACAVQCWWNN